MGTAQKAICLPPPLSVCACLCLCVRYLVSLPGPRLVPSHTPPNTKMIGSCLPFSFDVPAVHPSVLLGLQIKKKKKNLASADESDLLLRSKQTAGRQWNPGKRRGIGLCGADEQTEAVRKSSV